MKYFPFPDKTASREELTKDVLYQKIPQSDRERIVDLAWDTGVAAAIDILKRYGMDKSVEAIAKECGLTVERIDKDNIAGNVRYFSEYYSGRKKIVLYNDSIGKWAESNRCNVVDAEELILSHEFFHFLECTSIGLTSKQYQVTVIKIGKWILCRSGIRALSEIGAHGFSRTYYEIKGRLPKTELPENQGILLQNQAVNSAGFAGKLAVDKIFGNGLLGKMSGYKNTRR